MRRRLTSLCVETIRDQEAALGPSLSRRGCVFRAARNGCRIWYAALSAKHSPNQVGLFDWAALRGSFGRSDGFPLSASLTDPATRARHAADSICVFSTRRRGGITGFPLQRATPPIRAQHLRARTGPV